MTGSAEEVEGGWEGRVRVCEKLRKAPLLRAWFSKREKITEAAAGCEAPHETDAQNIAQSGLEKFVRTVLAEPHGWNSYAAMLEVLHRAKADRKGRAPEISALARHRIFRPSEKDLLDWRYHVVAEVIQISDRSARRRAIAGWRRRMPAMADAEKREYVDRRNSIDPPVGCRLVEAYIGNGKTGYVHLVERESDGARFAWKIPNDDGKRLHDRFEKEIELTRRISELGLSTMTAEWAEVEQISLLKSYVEGKTLREHLCDGPEFLVDEADPRTAALASIVEGSIEREIFFKSLNAEGLIYAPAKERWEIIDSGAIVVTGNRSEACRGWRDVVGSDWIRSSMGLGTIEVRQAVAAFLDEHVVGP
ncbi:MAG: hypothetical protein JRG80_02965 [Deltaproteobacteria bacterium]|nr:hypothetical protein [Deltaproteobacteria bacterium]